MANTLDTYANLITSEHRDKPNFMAMVQALAEIFLQIQKVDTSMIDSFDLDNASGAQQDILGQWIGVSRNVSIPVAGIYFSWDDTQFDGWDYGSWKSDLQPTTITTLPDDAYLTLLRAKIAANKWDGTIEGAYAIWDSIFPNYKILIQDYQNMTYAMAIVGSIVDSLTLALLTGGYIPLKPSTIRIVNYFVPVNAGPLFGWDVESDYLNGWDSGSWAREISPS